MVEELSNTYRRKFEVSVEGTGNIEEVVLASCTPPLERSAFPPLLIPVLSPRYHSPSPEPALADFTIYKTGDFSP